MCHASVLKFGTDYLTGEVVEGANILEVGSLDINGSLRTPLSFLRTKSYLGVDIIPGPGVDQLCNVYDLESTFGENSFDVIIATELLEHVEDWRRAISNLKRVCRKYLLVTTRAPGFPLHEYPADYWRFSVDDFSKIFSDYEIITLAADEQVPGVFVFARKPDNFLETDLSNIHPTTPGD